MIKNRTLHFLTFLFVLFIFSFPGYTEDTKAEPSSPIASAKVPNVEVPEMVYKFSGIYEDALVTHDFVIKNTGDAQLDIVSVKPG